MDGFDRPLPLSYGHTKHVEACCQHPEGSSCNNERSRYTLGMPAITVGFPEFEARLERIRRRINLLHLQDAACISGATTLFCASAILIAAVAGNPATFAWILRLGAVAALAVLSISGWMLYHRWLDLEGTARLIDRKAQLENRIATMLANPSRESASPLRSILLTQVFEFTPRWTIDTIAPRELRRPAIALMVAASAFLATGILLPEPPPPPPPEIATGRVSSAVANTGDQQPVVARALATGDGPKDSTGQASQPGGANRQPGKEPQQNQSAQPNQKNASDDQESTRSDRHDREKERHAKNDTPGLRPKPDDSVQPKDESNRQGSSPPKNPPKLKAPGKANKDPGQRKGPRKVQNGKSGGSKVAAKNKKHGAEKGSSGLLAKETKALGEKGDKAKPMLIRLKAFSAVPPPRFEPQGNDTGASAAAAEARAAEEITIGHEQLDDRPLQRTAISPVHEALMRELFTPRN